MLYQYDVPENIQVCTSVNIIFQECVTRTEQKSYCQVVATMLFNNRHATHVCEFPSWQNMLREFETLQELVKSILGCFPDFQNIPAFIERIDGGDGLYDLSKAIIIF